MNTTILPTTKYQNSPLGLIPEYWECLKELYLIKL